MDLDEAHNPDGQLLPTTAEDLILDLRWQLEEAQRTIHSLESWLQFERSRTVERQLAFDGMEDHE
jgi:hypothetical protein